MQNRRELTGGKYARLNAHGFYWTSTEIDAMTAWNFNFGAGGRALHCQDGMEKPEGGLGSLYPDIAQALISVRIPPR